LKIISLSLSDSEEERISSSKETEVDEKSQEKESSSSPRKSEETKGETPTKHVTRKVLLQEAEGSPDTEPIAKRNKEAIHTKL